MIKKALATEWCLLQNQYDSYEKHSLYIKMLSIVVMLVAVTLQASSFFIVLLLLVLWLQDAIWKTFQSRIEPRLLQLELYLKLPSELEPSQLSTKAVCVFQFNSEYQKVKLTGLLLIKEYIAQSVRPTVAFPHLVLILLLLITSVF
ncbi:hypothetical protein [Rheinheimera sp. MMS21-TC3]|uniref:hypothetical protein n=1 Tax=Rheinheimera sp. MMS21-TC3 TaxID=3072790 RepID=UPI0028C3C648|nr:hypothetical protein [Rheinheimera sp. MMS21-TC3]WNO60219.1 hypothetical protein RDV63_04450 [Rheinheimera sp. MMS21-TC3]